MVLRLPKHRVIRRHRLDMVHAGGRQSTPSIYPEFAYLIPRLPQEPFAVPCPPCSISSLMCCPSLFVGQSLPGLGMLLAIGSICCQLRTSRCRAGSSRSHGHGYLNLQLYPFWHPMISPYLKITVFTNKAAVLSYVLPHYRVGRF